NDQGTNGSVQDFEKGEGKEGNKPSVSKGKKELDQNKNANDLKVGEDETTKKVKTEEETEEEIDKALFNEDEAEILNRLIEEMETIEQMIENEDTDEFDDVDVLDIDLKEEEDIDEDDDLGLDFEDEDDEEDSEIEYS
ncbi:MAG: hypothetical protein ACTSX1_07175, partial [Candidatus Heimdallarchaeaceae archaeon]